MIKICFKILKEGIVKINFPKSNDHDLLNQINKANKSIQNFEPVEEELVSTEEVMNIRDAINNANKLKKHIVIDRGTNYFFNKKENRYIAIDDGVLDIVEPGFIDKDIDIFIKNLRNNIFPDFLSSINEELGGKYSYSHCSLYIYKNVNSPRCLHVDSISPQIKLFLSFSEISKISQGPYCYIKKSHKYKLIHKFNYLINFILGSDMGNNPRDATLFSSIIASPIFTKKYDFILSNNCGVHGDFPSSIKLNSGKKF